MARELRQRKAITYNESVLSLEAGKTAASPEEIAKQGSLLRFTRTGIDNTSKTRSSTLDPGNLQVYRRKRRRNAQAAGTESHSRRCRA